MPRHRALAPVAALVLLGSALAVSAGISPATAAPSGGSAQLRVAGVTAKVKAQQVTVSYSVSNRTKGAQPGKPVIIRLTSAFDTVKLARARTPSLAGGQSKKATVVSKLKATVAPGKYAVSVCVGDTEPAHCATAKKALKLQPELSADPASLTFDPSVLSTTSAARTVTFTNSGAIYTGPLDVALPDPTFTIASTCQDLPHGLAPGASCTVAVKAAPNTAGVHASTLTVRGDGTTATVALSATGLTSAILTVTPATKAYGNSPVGTQTADTTFTVKNTGQVSSGVLSASLTNATDFVLGTNGCTAALAPGATCDVKVAFKAATAGAKTGSLAINGVPGGNLAVALTGTGTTTNISITPTTVVFPNTPATTASAPQVFTVTNTTGVATGSLTASLTDPLDFTLGANTCTGVLAAGATCTVSVTFTPATPVPGLTASLNVTGTPGGTATATLSGTGT